MDVHTRGFTLIELLVVIVIVGVLAAIAIPRFMNARYDAFRSTALSDLRNLQAVQEMHRQSGTGYASELEDLQYETSRGVLLEITEATETGWAATASHTGFPSVGCGIFIGTADPANGSPATVQGVVACNR